MVRKLFYVLLGAMAFLQAQAETAPENLPDPHVRLQLLDKVTGHTQVIEIHHQEAITFGTLKIHLHRCHRSSAQEIPWSTAYIDVWEEDTYQVARPVYNGWIFSSNAATIEHPVYDVRLLECLQCTTCCQNAPVSSLQLPPAVAAAQPLQEMVGDE